MLQLPSQRVTLRISKDPYAHQDPIMRQMLNECGDMDLVSSQLPDNESHVVECDETIDDTEPRIDFLATASLYDSLAVPCQVMKRAFGYRFYDRDGSFLHATTMLIPLLRAQFEFVVTPCGAVLTKNCEDMALLRKGNNFELARIKSLILEDSGNLRMRYQMFNDDYTFGCVSYKPAIFSTDLSRYYCNAYVALGLPSAGTLFQSYTNAVGKLQTKNRNFGIARIGTWSRKHNVQKAIESWDVMDIADFLQFYHIRPEWMWFTRLGRYVCETFIQSSLNLFLHSEDALSILELARNADTFETHPRATSANICMMCGRTGHCSQTIVINQHLHVDVDARCFAAIELVHLVTQTLMRFRRVVVPIKYEYDRLQTMFAVARVLLRNLQDTE